MVKGRALAVIATLGLVGCGSDEPVSAKAPICNVLTETCDAIPQAPLSHSPPITVAPSDGMPPQVVSQTAHNNLDIAWHEGRLFFAFRTAHLHFAGPEVVMYVVSTTDQRHWRYEGKIELGTDVREPRFLSLRGHLFLYFAVLGQNPILFQPQGTRVVEWLGPGRLSSPREIFDPTFIPWRTRTDGGVGYLIGYTDGGNIYSTGEGKIQVQWLETTNGIDFSPVVEGQPVVLESGGSETDIALREDGSLIAVSRNEAGDELGFGMRICKAEPEHWGEWKCVADPKKYDSPLLIQHGGRIFLIGRRNISDTGNFDLGRDDLTPAEATLEYQLDYWKRPKRCALWEVDPEKLSVSFLLDLPSKGDTCFASAVPLKDDGYLVYNYTSPLDGPDRSWLDGQNNPTQIYWTALTLPGR